MKSLLNLIIICLILSNCSSNHVAKIKINDKLNWQNETFRYVNWDGETYSPGAFVSVANNKGIKIIHANSNSEEHTNCLIAIANKMDIQILINNKNFDKEVVKGKYENCTYPITTLAKPTLLSNQVLIKITPEGISIPNSEPLSPNEFISVMREMEQNELLVEDLTVQQLFCMMAVVTILDKKLIAIKKSGELSPFSITGNPQINGSCDFIKNQ